MPTVSIVSRAALAVACVAALGVVVGCAGRTPVVHDELLEPLAVDRPWLPSDVDLAAARLARAALVAETPTASAVADPKDASANARVEAALAELEALEPDEAQPNVPALARDLRNATLDDPLADRAASRTLARRRGLDPRLEARLDRLIRDDPLELAGRRRFDGWHRLWARTFNAVVEPIGSSAITGFVLAPYQLANSLIHYFAEFSNTEPLSSTDRQALALQQEFLARHPDSPIAAKVERQVERDAPKRAATFAGRSLRAAERALDARAWRLAIHHAERAASLLEPFPDENGRLRERAERIVGEARSGRERHAENRRRALGSVATRDALAATERDLSIALLAEDRTPLEVRISAPALDAPLRRASLDAYVDARTQYLRAMAQHEAGFEAGARRRLTQAARGVATDDTMARHARVLLDDDWQNPHGAFERLARKATRDELAWRLAGEWVNRPRYPNLPTPVAYLIDAPAVAITVVMAPLRALVSPFTGGTPDFRRGAALAGYRYLIRHPDGEERRAITRWLYDYELSEERYGRALRMADWIPEFDEEERADLVEKTTEERVARVDELDRRDERSSILRGVAREFPDSTGGRDAGLRARAEREDASPQHIRITREYLLENPEVAGGRGVGLNPALLDEAPTNGELHPEGIVLRGGRMLEVRLVDEAGDDDTPPASRYVELSPRRLRQLASALEEATRRNGLIDPDARQDADPRRDLFLERAALGLTDEIDPRATAESSFVYLSLRERYGIVRGRDSVLPFDLVFRGSLGDFTLGAFPRWRPPRETPDAFLYR